MSNVDVMSTMSPTERDFVNILPDQYRHGAFMAYKEYRKNANFTSVFERAKLCTAWMQGFVVATHFVTKEDSPSAEKPGIVPEIPGE